MRTFEVNDIVTLQRSQLYWILEGSRILNPAPIKNVEKQKEFVRCKITQIKIAPSWGNLALLDIEDEPAPAGCSWVALCKAFEPA